MDWNKILEEQEHDPGVAPAPAGTYPVRVVKAEGVVASTGNEMIKTQIEIVGGAFDKKQIITNIVFARDNPQAMRFTLRKLAALGVSREQLAATNPGLSQLAALITGAECEAEITIKEYEGEKSNDVKKFINRTPSATPASAPSSDVPPPPPIPDVPPPPTIEASAPEPQPEPAAAPAAEPDPEEPF